MIKIIIRIWAILKIEDDSSEVSVMPIKQNGKWITKRSISDQEELDQLNILKDNESYRDLEDIIQSIYIPGYIKKLAFNTIMEGLRIALLKNNNARLEEISKTKETLLQWVNSYLSVEVTKLYEQSRALDNYTIYKELDDGIDSLLELAIDETVRRKNPIQSPVAPQDTLNKNHIIMLLENIFHGATRDNTTFSKNSHHELIVDINGHTENITYQLNILKYNESFHDLEKIIQSSHIPGRVKELAFDCILEGLKIALMKINNMELEEISKTKDTFLKWINGHLSTRLFTLYKQNMRHKKKGNNIDLEDLNYEVDSLLEIAIIENKLRKNPIQPPAISEGPLDKNLATRYLELIFIYAIEGQVTFSENNRHEIIVDVNGHSENLSYLLGEVNLTHFQLDDDVLKNLNLLKELKIYIDEAEENKSDNQQENISDWKLLLDERRAIMAYSNGYDAIINDLLRTGKCFVSEPRKLQEAFLLACFFASAVNKYKNSNLRHKQLELKDRFNIAKTEYMEDQNLIECNERENLASILSYAQTKGLINIEESYKLVEENFVPNIRKADYTPKSLAFNEGIMSSSHGTVTPLFKDRPFTIVSSFAESVSIKDHAYFTSEQEAVKGSGESLNMTDLGDNVYYASVVNTPDLERPTDYIYLHAVQVAYDSYLKNPYKESNTSATDLKHRSVERPRHGLAHTLRTIYYVDNVLAYLKQHAKTEQARNFYKGINKDEIEKIKVALAFYVTGQESEISCGGNLEKLSRYGEQSISNFRHYVTEELHWHPEDVNRYAEIFLLSPAATEQTEKNWLSDIINFAHKLDLPRYYTATQMQAAMEKFIPDRKEAQNDFALLKQWAIECIKSTGDRLTCTVDIAGHYRSTEKNFEDSIFIAASTDPLAALKLLKSVPDQQFLFSEQSSIPVRQPVHFEQHVKKTTIFLMLKNSGAFAKMEPTKRMEYLLLALDDANAKERVDLFSAFDKNKSELKNFIALAQTKQVNKLFDHLLNMLKEASPSDQLALLKLKDLDEIYAIISSDLIQNHAEYFNKLFSIISEENKSYFVNVISGDIIKNPITYLKSFNNTDLFHLVMAISNGTRFQLSSDCLDIIFESFSEKQQEAFLTLPNNLVLQHICQDNSINFSRVFKWLNFLKGNNSALLLRLIPQELIQNISLSPDDAMKWLTYSKINNDSLLSGLIPSKLIQLINDSENSRNTTIRFLVNASNDKEINSILQEINHPDYPTIQSVRDSLTKPQDLVDIYRFLRDEDVKHRMKVFFSIIGDEKLFNIIHSDQELASLRDQLQLKIGNEDEVFTIYASIGYILHITKVEDLKTAPNSFPSLHHSENILDLFYDDENITMGIEEIKNVYQLLYIAPYYLTGNEKDSVDKIHELILKWEDLLQFLSLAPIEMIYHNEEKLVFLSDSHWLQNIVKTNEQIATLLILIPQKLHQDILDSLNRKEKPDFFLKTVDKEYVAKNLIQSSSSLLTCLNNFTVEEKKDFIQSVDVKKIALTMFCEKQLLMFKPPILSEDGYKIFQNKIISCKVETLHSLDEFVKLKEFFSGVKMEAANFAEVSGTINTLQELSKLFDLYKDYDNQEDYISLIPDAVLLRIISKQYELNDLLAQLTKNKSFYNKFLNHFVAVLDNTIKNQEDFDAVSKLFPSLCKENPIFMKWRKPAGTIAILSPTIKPSEIMPANPLWDRCLAEIENKANKLQENYEKYFSDMCDRIKGLNAIEDFKQFMNFNVVLNFLNEPRATDPLDILDQKKKIDAALDTLEEDITRDSEKNLFLNYKLRDLISVTREAEKSIDIYFPKFYNAREYERARLSRRDSYGFIIDTGPTFNFFYGYLLKYEEDYRSLFVTPLDLLNISQDKNKEPVERQRAEKLFELLKGTAKEKENIYKLSAELEIEISKIEKKLDAANKLRNNSQGKPQWENLDAEDSPHKLLFDANVFYEKIKSAVKNSLEHILKTDYHPSNDILTKPLTSPVENPYDSVLQSINSELNRTVEYVDSIECTRDDAIKLNLTKIKNNLAKLEALFPELSSSVSNEFNQESPRTDTELSDDELELNNINLSIFNYDDFLDLLEKRNYEEISFALQNLKEAQDLPLLDKIEKNICYKMSPKTNSLHKHPDTKELSELLTQITFVKQKLEHGNNKPGNLSQEIK